MASKGFSFNYKTQQEEPGVFPYCRGGQVVKQRERLTPQSISGISVIKEKKYSFFLTGLAGREKESGIVEERGHRALREPIQRPGRSRCDTQVL